jgi:YbbR domain-containing protein
MIREKVGRWIIKNPGWRLLSVVLAVIIWMNVATDPEMSTFISLPIQFKDPPNWIEVTSRTAETVQVEARGSAGQLRDLANSRPAVTLDFSEVREPGERTFTVERAAISLPRGVEIVHTTPAQLLFRFERSEHRRVPVKIRFKGEPANGLHVQSMRLQPETLEIVGPEARVRAIQEALSNPVDLAALNPAKPVVTAELYLTDARVRFVSQPRVTVTMVLK